MRLTPAQKKLYLDLVQETDAHPADSSWIEIHPEELRTARSLAKKGIVEIHNDHEARLLRRV